MKKMMLVQVMVGDDNNGDVKKNHDNSEHTHTVVKNIMYTDI